jgi:hypothetical protein
MATGPGAVEGSQGEGGKVVACGVEELRSLVQPPLAFFFFSNFLLVQAETSRALVRASWRRKTGLGGRNRSGRQMRSNKRLARRT